MKKLSKFDAAAFHGALDATRIARSLTWKDVADQSGVGASTLTRMGQGKNPDVYGLAALLSWSGLSINDFILPGPERSCEETIERITGIFSSDKNLTPKDALTLTNIILILHNAFCSPPAQAEAAAP